MVPVELVAAGEWSILPKEMLPIVVAAAVWGPQWRGLIVRCKCDNTAVVATIKLGSRKEAHTIHLRRCLASLEAVGEFILLAEHVKGKDNVVADALSRNKLLLSRSVIQGAEKEVEEVPQRLMALLAVGELNWSKQEWTELRSSIFKKA